jgi:hypothetical protein
MEMGVFLWKGVQQEFAGISGDSLQNLRILLLHSPKMMNFAQS